MDEDSLTEHKAGVVLNALVPLSFTDIDGQSQNGSTHGSVSLLSNFDF